MRRVGDKGVRGQVWVETVIYTLIGMTIIGLVLAAALPKINAKKDSATIEQSISALNNIDGEIYDVQKGVGNRRIVDLDVKKGAFSVDAGNDSVYWILDSSFAYSQAGVPISVGHINVTTSKKGGAWEVKLEMKYNVDIRYKNKNSGVYSLDVAPTPYTISVENDGLNSDNRTIVDLSSSS